MTLRAVVKAGGSAGVDYLRSTLPKRAFPDLWRVRTRLGQEP